MLIPLIYFILGILFIRYFCPLLDQLISWFQTSIEHKLMLITLENVKLEKRMNEVVGENEVPKTRQIGFVVDDPSEYEIDEEELYEDD